MPQSRDSAVPADEANRRVLLVEEGATVRLLVRTLLERWGCAVQVADPQRTDLPDPTGFNLIVVGATCRDADAIVAACSARALPVLALLPEGTKLGGATAEVALPINAQEFHVSLLHCLDRSLVQSMAEAGIDADEIVALWGTVDDPRYLRVVNVFIAEMTSRLPRLAGLLSGTDRAELELQAHSIKGAAANVGATVLHTVALRLETLSRTARSDELALVVAELGAVAELAIARLRLLAHTGNS